MTGNKVCSIICGAPVPLSQPELVTGLVIAADSGLDRALAAGIIPDIAVGDFDSASSPVPDSTERIAVSPIKDSTDALLAADTAISRGCTELRFFCALGGREDHSFANIQMLSYLHKRGVSARLYGEGQHAYLLHAEESAEIPRFTGYVSVFSYGESTEVSEWGMKYPLERHRLDNSFPLGVSNEVISEVGVITVHEGTALIFEEYKS